jgi:hypothetical protein
MTLSFIFEDTLTRQLVINMDEKGGKVDIIDISQLRVFKRSCSVESL